jgi:CheY-like chemotaxis protein
MKTLLVVDDEYDIVLALELMLTGEGYRVLTAANGREALDALERDSVDLVLMDLMMPVMTGAEALNAIRADPKLKLTPVIILSAVAPRSGHEPPGADAFLRKPFELDALLALIAKHLP